MAWSQKQADKRLDADLVRYAADVARAIGKAPTSQHQFDALASFQYNTGAIAKATLTWLHVAGYPRRHGAAVCPLGSCWRRGDARTGAAA